MDDMIGHNCGLCVAHTLHDAYSFIRSLQHRGREATGIAAVGDRQIDVIKWTGPVDRFDITDLHKILPSPHYHTYMAHVRYATRGRKDKILQDAHPHVVGGKMEHRGNHVLITDCEIAGIHNGQVDDQYLTGVDPVLLKTDCDSEALLHVYKEQGEHELLQRIPGAYTLAIADKSRREVIVLRDRTGIKPGVLGWKDGKYGMASEDIAFRKNGGEFIEDLDSGTLYYLAPDGSYRKEMVIGPAQLALCFFEWNYITDVDTVLNRVSVRRIRETLGHMLAAEFYPEGADLVTFLPRCPEVAARSYAKTVGLPFKPVFYKMRGERSFLGSTASEREKSIDENLHLLPHMQNDLQGKSVIMIDDSIIRGNNSRRARTILYEQAGVKRAYLVSYTPPIGIVGADGIPRGCLFGVDMPPDDAFIARGRTVQQISHEMNMTIVYLSIEGMLKAFEEAGIPARHLCTYCIGGQVPFIYRAPAVGEQSHGLTARLWQSVAGGQ